MSSRFTIKLLLAAMFIATTCVTFSFNEGKVTVVRSGDVYTSSLTPDSVIGKAKEGSALPVLQVTDDWVKIVLSQTARGWVRREILAMPDPDSVTISKNWPLMKNVGSHANDTTKSKLGYVSKGTRARKVLMYGSWYEIQLADGTIGWVHQIAIEPTVSEIAVVNEDVILLKDTVQKKFLAPNPEVKHKTHVVQLARGTRWSLVRTPDGREGWIPQSAVRLEEAMSVGATSVFWFRMFKWLDNLGITSLTMSLLISIVQWLIIPLVPVVIPFVIYYRTLGRMKGVSNNLLRLIFLVTVIGLGFYCLIYLFPGVPPYIGPFSEKAMFVWGGLLMVLSYSMLIDRLRLDRCDACRRTGAGEIVGSKHLGTQSKVETTRTTWKYKDGHTESEAKANTTITSSYLRTVECRYCHHVWRLRKSFTRRRSDVTEQLHRDF